MSFLRAALPRFWALALGEARLAAAGAQSYLPSAAIFTAWAAIAIFLGSVVGFAAVVLPPTGIFGIVLVAALILLWVLPELPVVAELTVRRIYFAFVLVTPMRSRLLRFHHSRDRFALDLRHDGCSYLRL